MKKVWLWIVLATMLQGAEMEWAASYDDAYARAQAQNKGVYLLITSESCQWCRKLESTTLRNEQVVKRLEANFVPVNIVIPDARKKEKEIERGGKKFKITVFPMNYFLANDGKVLVKMPGYWNVEDFNSILDDTEFKLKKADTIK
jgi:thioredoxin-related protein